MTEYNIRLNPNCASPVHTGLKFKSGDKGISFVIAVDELDTAGTTAKIVFLRANGTSVERDITETNGVFTYKTLGNEFAVPGKTVADVKFYTGIDRVSTASFVFEVSADTMDGLGAGAGGYSDRLEQLVSEAESAGEQAIAEAEAATAQARAELEQLVEEIEAAESNMKAVEVEMSSVLQDFKEQYGEVGALNPRGDWNSSTTYQIRDVVYYGRFSWTALAVNKGVTPSEANKNTWGKHMDMDGIEQKIANIQTTSRATLSQAGWYRVAEYKGGAINTQGNLSNSCEITIKRGTSSYGGTYRLYLESHYEKQEFKVKSVDIASHILTKIRYTRDTKTNTAYIEVYNTSKSTWFISIENGKDETYCWKAIDALATAETVDGVTVTTTYDIPANATPVTDLDVGYLSKAIAWSRLWTSVLSVGTGVYKIGSGEIPYITDLPSGVSKKCVLWLLVFKDTDENSYLLRQPASNTTWVGSQYGSKLSWSNPLVTTADLAKYLPLDGTGEVVASNLLPLKAKNSAANSCFTRYSGKDGVLGFLGFMDANTPYVLGSDGAGIGAILHAKNYGDYALPLDGGGEVQAANSNPLKVKNTSGNDCYIPFSGKGGTLGYLGFSDTDALIFVTADAAAATEILHTGNSARVVPATSAPSDTTVLWIDTANKKVKSYIDGAWTALA